MTSDERRTADGGQRREGRVTLNKEFDTFDAFVEEYVANVSRHGAFIRARDPLPVGTIVDLRFSVLADGAQATIEGEGRVVRNQDDPPGMGVVFTHVDHASRGLLDGLLVAPLAGSGTRAGDDPTGGLEDQ